MNKSIRWLLFVGLTSVAVTVVLTVFLAQPIRRIGFTRRAKAAARIQFTRTHVDLAETPVAKRVTAAFPFLNRGNDLLKVSEIRSSCTCTAARITTDRLAPGDAAEIQLTVEPESAARGSASVTVFCNDPLQRQTQLIVTWNAIAPLSLEPVELRFGEVEVGQTYRQRVKVVPNSASMMTARIKSIHTDPGGEIAATSTKHHQFCDEAEIELTPSNEASQDGGYAYLEIAGDWTGTLSVPVFWHTKRVVEIAPATLYLGGGQPAADFKAKLTIRDNPDQQASLQSIESSPPLDALTCTVERENKTTSVIWLTGRLPATHGLHRGELALTILSGEQIDHRLTWRCVVRNPNTTAAISRDTDASGK